VANSPSFVQHALDLLNAVRPVTARAMFGGHGLYADGLMFGLLDDDELFLRADDQTRQRFVDQGCKQWSYPTPKGPMLGPYHQPPAAAMDDPDELKPWLLLAIEATVRKEAAKKKKGTPKKRVVKKKVAKKAAAKKGSARKAKRLGVSTPPGPGGPGSARRERGDGGGRVVCVVDWGRKGGGFESRCPDHLSFVIPTTF
jgi:DNA transformation protein